jgi:polysaccharide biosynthesis/export protein
MSVLTAITIAGGHTFRANTKSYSINRTENGNTVKGKGTDDTRMLPGDIIVVHESWF